MTDGISHTYVDAVIAGECEQVARIPKGNGQRNYNLNRAAFRVGSLLPYAPEYESKARDGLLQAALGNGYVNDHGRQSALAVIESGLDAGKQKPRQITRHERKASVAVERKARSPSVESQVAINKTFEPAAKKYPARTPPNENGRPIFYFGGDSGPRVSDDELRRHAYKRDGVSVRIKVKRKGGAFVNWYRVVDASGKSGWQAKKPEGYVECPYTGGVDPFDNELVNDLIFWPEGEKDVDTLASKNIPAFTFGGAGDGLPERPQQYLSGRHVVILSDNDDAGREHAEKKAAACHAVAASVRIVHFADVPHKGDVSDWLAGGRTGDDLDTIATAVSVWTPPQGDEPQQRGLIVHQLSAVEPEKIEWLWPGRVARGKLVLIGGPPGLGKSQITAAMAAAVSTGGRWPCNEGDAPLGNAVMFSAEDGLRDTIAPRLIAAAADCTRVHAVTGVVDDKGRRTFNLKADIAMLEEHIRRIGDVRLLTIDPISAYMGGTDGNGNVETREVLEPISDLADRLKIAVVAVTHLNKGGGGGGKQSALNRFVGSIAFTAAARAAFAVIEDAEDDQHRLFLQVKNNLGSTAKGLGFRIEQRLVANDIVAANICWDTDYVDTTADQALTASEGGIEISTTKADAMEFLRVALSSGPYGGGRHRA